MAPGFDFHDFAWVGAAELRSTAPHLEKELLPFVKEVAEGVAEDIKGINEYYDDDAQRAERASKRLD